jgi:hypothetical protein
MKLETLPLFEASEFKLDVLGESGQLELIWATEGEWNSLAPALREGFEVWRLSPDAPFLVAFRLTV